MSFGVTAAVVGTVVGGNALLGDPLHLGGGNDGSDAANASADASRQTSAIAADQWKYYKSNYQPLETSLINQATQAGTKQEFDAAAGRANADVTGAFDQARKQTESRMQSYGINPGSPAYQSTAASVDLAQGAAKAGALTNAYNTQKNLAYSKALDVVGLGRNIPAQSSASSANAANAANNASQTQFFQNQRNQQNIGYGLNSLAGNAGKLYGAAGNWFGNGMGSGAAANTDAYSNMAAAGGPAPVWGMKEGGPVTRFQSGGLDNHEKVRAMLKDRGMSDDAATKVITPHMRGMKPRGYAQGGGVGSQGATIDNETGQVIGPGTETSDSVPAQIDGQQPAALSSGEFVMNAEVPKLSGDEILEAINQAGLKKRQSAGLDTMSSNDVSPNAGAAAYAKGGEVQKWDRAQAEVGRYYDYEAPGIPGLQYSGSVVTVGDNEGERSDDHYKQERAAKVQNTKPVKRMAEGGEVGLDPSWYRGDGSKKGHGFLGDLKFNDGRTSSELSIGVNIDGKEMEIPSLVPTLTQQEIQHMLAGNRPTPAIVQKAVEHARMRISGGKPVFAGDEDSPMTNTMAYARGGRVSHAGLGC